MTTAQDQFCVSESTENEFVHCLTWSWTGFYFCNIRVSCLLFVFRLDGAAEEVGSLVTPHCQPWERVMAALIPPVGPHKTAMQR